LLLLHFFLLRRRLLLLHFFLLRRRLLLLHFFLLRRRLQLCGLGFSQEHTHSLCLTCSSGLSTQTVITGCNSNVIGTFLGTHFLSQFLFIPIINKNKIFSTKNV
jgi:hypothetical protein